MQISLKLECRLLYFGIWIFVLGDTWVEITGTNMNWRWWATQRFLAVSGGSWRSWESCYRQKGELCCSEQGGWKQSHWQRGRGGLHFQTLDLSGRWETHRDFQWSLYLQHRNCVLPWPSSCLHLYSVGPSPPFIPWCWTSLVVWQRCNTSF